MTCDFVAVGINLKFSRLLLTVHKIFLEISLNFFNSYNKNFVGTICLKF